MPKKQELIEAMCILFIEFAQTTKTKVQHPEKGVANWLYQGTTFAEKWVTETTKSTADVWRVVLLVIWLIEVLATCLERTAQGGRMFIFSIS